MIPFDLICPRCGAKLHVDDDVAYCPADDSRFAREDGIWRLLLPDEQAYFEQFMTDYQFIRAGEGRGSDDSAWYRRLPYLQEDARYARDWRIRAKSYTMLLKTVIVPLESEDGKPLAIIDLGAGNGWLSNRMAARGHKVAAVDLLDNAWDGLGAKQHYETTFIPIQASFDRVPLAADSADVVIYNGALHYAVDYMRSLCEGLRLLKPGGRLVVMDTPLYHDASSGEQMVKEREAYFEHTYGTPSNTLPSEHFLTYNRLYALGESLMLHWRIHTPWYSLRWALRPLKARLRGHREPARFHVIIGERAE